MKIGELSKKTGVAASTIRYYEQIGLLPAPRRQSGRRVYDESVLRRLAVIRHFISLGFSLNTIKEMGLSVLVDGLAPAGWPGLAQKRLQAIDNQIADLIDSRQQLIALQQCQCASIATCAVIGLN